MQEFSKMTTIQKGDSQITSLHCSDSCIDVDIYATRPRFFYLISWLISDREAREIMYLVASVRPFVCLSVCVCSTVRTVWPMTLIFGTEVDISEVNVKVKFSGA